MERDIVEELRRSHSQLAPCGGDGAPLCTRCEAAREIEKLRAQIDELRPHAIELAQLRMYENSLPMRPKDRERFEYFTMLLTRITRGDFGYPQ